MENEFAILSLLETALQKSLGDRYRVNSEPLYPSPQGQHHIRPDLVVWPQDEPKRPIIVELKMLNKEFDLPLSVASQTRRMIEENQGANPMLILATNSRVGTLLRRELDGQNVTVVQSDVPSALADDISNVIRQTQARS